MRSDRTHVLCGLLLAAVAQGGCAGEDAAADAEGVPAFGQFPNPPVGQSAGVAGNGNPPVGAGGSAPAPQGSAGATNNEGNLTPVGLEPSAGGAGGGAAGAGAVAAAGASLGGAAATNEGGAAGAVAAGGSENVGGSGMALPDEPEPVEPASSCPASALFCDDFEDDVTGQFPGAPWQDNTAGGATVQVDGVQAFSGERAVHVNAPPNQSFRRCRRRCSGAR